MTDGETIATVRDRDPAAFVRVIEKIRELGTDNRWIFGADYRFEGGLRLQQRTTEVTALLLFLQARRPRGAYLEIGTASGGTTRLMNEYLSFDQVLSIDDGRHPDAHLQDDNLAAIANLARYRGDSHAPAAREFIERELRHPVAVALVDGDHSYEGVAQDTLMVLSCVHPGTLLVVHDTVAVPDVGRYWHEGEAAGLFIPVAHFVDDHHAACGIGVAEVRSHHGDALVA